VTGNEKVDRLALIVSDNGLMKLLGVPLVTSGTCQAQTTAVFQLIDDRRLKDIIHFMQSSGAFVLDMVIGR
jgi:hypothetical protein